MIFDNIASLLEQLMRKLVLIIKSQFQEKIHFYKFIKKKTKIT